MLKDIAFGQYYPVSSFLHRADPRMKLLSLVAFIVAIFLASNYFGIGLCIFGFVLALAASRVPVRKVFRSVKGILFLLVFTAIIQLFFYKGETVLFSWWKIVVTKEALFYTLFLILRLVLLVTVASLLTFTTTPVALTDGLESLLYPLKLIRFPVHELALIMSIALRFIPTLIEETERIMNAQKARGAEFERGSLFSRAKAVIPVLIPLLISAFRRAEELGDAMDARCYAGSKVRTKYKKMSFGWRDLVIFLVMAGLIAGVVLVKQLPGMVF